MSSIRKVTRLLPVPVIALIQITENDIHSIAPVITLTTGIAASINASSCP